VEGWVAPDCPDSCLDLGPDTDTGAENVRACLSSLSLSLCLGQEADGYSAAS